MYIVQYLQSLAVDIIYESRGQHCWTAWITITARALCHYDVFSRRVALSAAAAGSNALTKCHR